MIWQEKSNVEYVVAEDEIKLDESTKVHLKKKPNIKINIRLVYSILLITCIFSNVGTSTLSWFTSNAASKPGIITLGTFNIKLNTESNSNQVAFDMGNIQPGVATDEKVVTFINSGTLNMVLRGNMNMVIEDRSGSRKDTNVYKVIAYVYKNDINSTPLYKPELSQNLTEVPEDISNFNSKLNIILDNTNGDHLTFKPSDKLIFKFKLILPGSLAKNDNQGDVVTGEFKLEARQDIEGATYSE